MMGMKQYIATLGKNDEPRKSWEAIQANIAKAEAPCERFPDGKHRWILDRSPHKISLTYNCDCGCYTGNPSNPSGKSNVQKTANDQAA